MKKPDQGSSSRKATEGKRSSLPKGEEAAPDEQIRIRSAAQGPVVVRHFDAPPAFERRQSIHPRRMLPRVVEGRERHFHSTSRQLSFVPSAARLFGEAVAPDDVAIAFNTELIQPALNRLASNVGEPSAAMNRNVVLYTGNWYTAVSNDGGQTFQYIDPFRSFPDPPGLGFCCDQVVNFIPAIDTFVWLLQYGAQPNQPQADNIQRLAFAKTDDVAAGRWRLFDITTDSLGVAGQFLDFPDLAVGANALYVTTNLFSATGQSAGAAVVRIPFASIDSGQVAASRFVSQDANSFRVAQNCGATAYFATHRDTSTLQVFSWPEGQAAPSSSLVEVARWIGGAGYHSRTPDGRSWLDRADPRITGATLAGTDLYFAWSVAAGSNERPQPFIQVARINSQDLTLLENINVFDADSATCYPALSTNADGEVGISYMIGGGPRFPSHVVGVLTGARKDVVAAIGERGPLPGNGGGEWGDYLTVRPVNPDRKLFLATGYTMKGAGDGSNRDATPRFVVFGRVQGAAVAAAGGLGGQTDPTNVAAPPIATAPLKPTPPADGDPISDIDSLGVVSPDIAAKIKAAAGLVADGAPQARPAAFPAALPEQIRPGTERWHVKTGQDPDRAKVGKNVVDGVDLGAGVVESTVEELGSLPRPPGLEDDKADPPEFQDVRDGVAEITIWRVDGQIISIKHEQDGDYHLVLQGTSGQQMIAEVPRPSQEFVGDSLWLDNFEQARKEIDDKLVRRLSPNAFGLVRGKFMPHGAMRFQPRASAPLDASFATPPRDSRAPQPLFQSAIEPTAVRVTGVGFFDRSHGATGAAPNVIELHPVLKIEWL